MLFFSATQCGLKQIYLLVEYTMSLFACCFFVVVVVVFIRTFLVGVGA